MVRPLTDVTASNACGQWAASPLLLPVRARPGLALGALLALACCPACGGSSRPAAEGRGGGDPADSGVVYDQGASPLDEGPGSDEDATGGADGAPSADGAQVSDGGEPPVDAAPTPDAAAGGGALVISARATDTCGSWLPDHQPELSYQTPTRLHAGVTSVELLRSHKALDPVSLLLDAAVVDVDLSAGGALVQTTTAGLPPGDYTHVRVGLAYSRYRVRATGHEGVPIAGTLDIDLALSAHTDEQGSPRAAGQYVATFSAMGREVPIPGSTPLNCVLSNWGGIAATVGQRFSVLVPIPGGPVTVSGDGTQEQRVELLFPMQDSFGWRELDAPGFADGVLDVGRPPLQPMELPDALVECNLLMADRCLGEAVVPLHPTWPMPDSNIDFCTDGGRIVDACPGPEGPLWGQDAHYDVHAPDYEPDDHTVFDRVTGLRWQRATPAETYDWWEARTYCRGLELGGHTEWRLPSRVELVSLLDFGGLDPTIDPDAFPDALSDFYWSASPVPFLNMAYGVRFELGFIYDHDPHSTGRVRCVLGDYVRPQPRFELEPETVLDRGTGLVWQRRHVPDALDWAGALAACEELELAGHTDWRLPTLKEQQTIVDERRLQPCIDVVAFPDTPSEWFWSSTPITVPPNEGWSTSYTDGYASIHAFTELHLVRCVRLGP